MKNIKFKRILILPIAILAFVFAFMQFKKASAVVDTSWGPQDRPTYTWDHPADHVTFNSITDNPFLGDERNFVRVREAGTDNEVDEITIEPGKEYQISVYYHNDATAALNDSGKGISRNTYLRAEFPKYLEAGQKALVTAFITASNAEPQMVWDGTYLKTNTPVYLSFVPNSAVISNNGTTNGTVLSGDALLSETGVTLGHYDTMWGMIPGCNEYGGYVNFRIKAEQPSFEIDKKVALNNSEDYKDEVVAAPGDTLKFRIHYTNTGTMEQTGVTVHDEFPNGLSYIANSTFASSTRHPEGAEAPESLFGDGLGLGAMIAGEEAWVTYKGRLSDSKDLFPCGDTVIYNNASVATNSGEGSDETKIIVRRVCDTPTTPKELPTTGPGEIILAAGIVVVIIGGGVYFYHSRKMLKKATSAAGGVSNSAATDISADDFMKRESDTSNSDIENTQTNTETTSTMPQENVENTQAIEDKSGEDIVKDGIQN